LAALPLTLNVWPVKD